MAYQADLIDKTMGKAHCNICGRPITSKESVEADAGPVCRERKVGNRHRHGGAFALAVLNRPTTMPVMLYRSGELAETNLPRSVAHHSPDGFEWGYAGSGPADLALNILNAYIPPGFDGHAPVPCWHGYCSQTAWQLHQPFKDRFLVSLPRSGRTIASDEILAWLDKRREWVNPAASP